MRLRAAPLRATLLAAGVVAGLCIEAADTTLAPTVAAADPRRQAVHVAADPVTIQIVPGGGPVHVQANDQDGNRLDPRLFSWAVPAGADIGVQLDATGWILTAPVSAGQGIYVIPVQFLPSPMLSPNVTVVVGKPITKIQIVASPP